MATVDVIANRSSGTEALGKAYFETDTNSFIVWNGLGWVELQSDGTGAAQFQNQYSVAFGGTNEYMSLGNLGSAGRSLGAMLMWVNVTSTNGIHSASSIGTLFGFDDGTAGQQFNGLSWGYWNASTDLMQLFVGARITVFAAPTAGDKLTAGWHLIGVNHNGTSYDIIVDGVTAPNVTLNSGSTGSYSTQVASGIISGTAFENVKVMSGQYALANSYNTQGLCDEVAIWDSALSSLDITNIYNGGIPVDLTSYSPNGWWRMGDNETGVSNGSTTPTTITDLGVDSNGNPTGNDGTLANSPTFSTTVP